MARQNYFEFNIKRGGVDFLKRKNAQFLQYDAFRIFRDIAKGDLDVREYEEYLSDHQLLETLVLVANQKHQFHYVSYMGIQALSNDLNFCNNPMIPITSEFHMKTAEVYNIIYLAFLTYRDTGQIDYLLPMAGQLRNYRDYV